MSVHELRPTEPPAEWSAVLRELSASGPISESDLVEAVRLDAADVEDVLLDSALAYESPDGWVNLMTVADGAVFTHTLTCDEVEAGRLYANGDLALWERLAEEDDLPLRGGGSLSIDWIGEQPDEQLVLAGPDGWLSGFEEGDLLALGLRDGIVEMSTASVEEPVSPELRRSAATVAAAFAGAAVESLNDLPRLSEIDFAPGARIDEVLAALLLERPDTFAEPLPPLTRMLHAGQLEVVDGRVGPAGMPWDPRLTAGMDPADVVRYARARAALRMWGAVDDFTSFLRHLGDSELVLAKIADDVEARPLDADRLTAIRRAASGPAQRAAALLLAARSAEGTGRADEAAELVEEVLQERPDLGPALCDAAEYAACKGDALRADGLLRTAGFSSDDGMRRWLRPLTALPAASTSRNRPCPCGSGQKYKMCCLRKEIHPLTTRAALLYGLLVTYAERGRHFDQIVALMDLCPRVPVMFGVELALFERGYLAEFLAERGPWLREDERELLARWEQSPLRLYEVVSSRPGRDATVRHLPDGDPVVLPDRTFSRSAEPLDLVLARLLDDGSRLALFTDPLRVHRSRRREMLDLLDGDVDPSAVMRFFAPQPPPELRNQDGHELTQCSATYDVDGGDEAWAALAKDLSEEGQDRLVAIVDDVVRGSVRRAGTRWTVEANSLERLRELQQLLLAAAPDARHRSESSVPLEELIGSAAPPAGLGAASAPASPEEMEQVMAEVIRQYEEAWLDDAIPALGGRTPREAAAEGGAALAELTALLDDFEWSSRQEGGGMSGERIRTLLGLPPGRVQGRGRV
ncbi:SEC-C domain-containing protein [Actinopolymorpha sp. B11F2]|uniref:YecA family protein n=1 Tax=Actinopolymorpha sp. B11F2 TaxID=3160862 RepID=UPI0032E408E8